MCMKKISLLCACITLVIATHAYAEDAVPAETPAIDPTLNFFMSLSTCTPGTYTERNDISSTVGVQNLQQVIIGKEDDVCSVVLSTPDNRQMTCSFDMKDLASLSDQHFLQGLLTDSSGDTDSKSVASDTLWSDLKAKSCNFNLN